MIKKYFSLLLIITTIISCSSDDDTSNDDSNSVHLKTITRSRYVSDEIQSSNIQNFTNNYLTNIQGGNSLQTYEYVNGLLSKIKSYDLEGTIHSMNEYIFDNNERLIMTRQSLFSKEAIYEKEFEYSNHQINVVESRFDLNHNLIWESDYFFYLDNQNRIIKEEYPNSDLTYEITYENNNPFRFTRITPQQTYTSIHNFGTEQVTDAYQYFKATLGSNWKNNLILSGGILVAIKRISDNYLLSTEHETSEEETTYNYEFDSDGRLVKEIKTTTSSPTVYYESIYEYE